MLTHLELWENIIWPRDLVAYGTGIGNGVDCSHEHIRLELWNNMESWHEDRCILVQYTIPSVKQTRTYCTIVDSSEIMRVDGQFAPNDPYFCLLTSSAALLPVPVALLPVSVFGTRSQHFRSLRTRFLFYATFPNPNHNHFQSPYFRFRCFSGSFAPLRKLHCRHRFDWLIKIIGYLITDKWRHYFRFRRGSCLTWR